MERTKILFVCSGNSSRSPSFEKWFKDNRPQYDVRSAGIYHGYPYQVNKEILEWAEKIYLMDISHEKFISERYPSYIDKCEIIGISDQYVPFSDTINNLIHYWAKKKGL